MSQGVLARLTAIMTGFTTQASLIRLIAHRGQEMYVARCVCVVSKLTCGQGIAHKLVLGRLSAIGDLQ